MIGFVLVTTAGVREGSVRGANRRLRKSEQPNSFWTAVVIYYAVAAAMVLYGLLA